MVDKMVKEINSVALIMHTINRMPITKHELLPKESIEENNFKTWSTAHHMPLKLFFALHETEAKFTKIQLQRVIVFWWKGGEIPCLNLISSKFYCCNIFHFCKFFMFTQTGSIKLLMALYNRIGQFYITSSRNIKA